MRPSTGHLSRLLTAVLMTILIAGCGSNSNTSSTVLWGASAVIDSAGTLWTWGANGFGQLGDGNSNDSSKPVSVGSYSAVAIGGGHVVALASGGALTTWGYNSNGQLGNNSTSSSTSPVQVSITGATVTAVAAGSRHSLALTSDGNVYAWGYNFYGQLGNGGTTDSSTPVQVTGLPAGITKIAAGGFFSMALDGSGNVWTWGDDRSGQMGNNTSSTTGVTSPVKVLLSEGVTPLSGIVDIAAGGSHCLAIDSTGNIWSWGLNFYGQLGNGTDTTPQMTAVKAWDATATGLAATAISAGLDHSLALINNSVYSCGHDYNGQLGNGADLLKDTPYTNFEPITGSVPAFSSITAVGNQSIAVDTSGHVWTWGANAYGQLGDGTTTDRSTAAQIF